MKTIELTTPEIQHMRTERTTVIAREIKNLADGVESITSIPGVDRRGDFTVVSSSCEHYVIRSPFGGSGDLFHDPANGVGGIIKTVFAAQRASDDAWVWLVSIGELPMTQAALPLDEGAKSTP